MGDGLKRANAAAKATRKPTIRKATAAENAMGALMGIAMSDDDSGKARDAQAVIMRAALAAAEQSKVEAACERTSAVTTQAQMARIGGKANDAQRETCAAGAALAKALRALRVPS